MTASQELDLGGLAQRLTAALAEKWAGAQIDKIKPLAGGACQDNFVFEMSADGDTTRKVLRSDAPRSLPRSRPRRSEYKVIRAATEAGVTTPQAQLLIEDLVRPGASAYVMDFVPGVAIGRQVLRAPELADARAGLPARLAEELAKIHSVTPETHPDLFGDDKVTDPVENDIAGVTKMIDEMVEPHPALEIVLRWLEDNRPSKRQVVLNHGDFRTGNFLVGPQGLMAILDWEFSQWGAPEEDLAWISVRDWRFGALDKPIGGFGDRETFYRAYEAASGREVDRAAVHYYEILGNVRWATGCVFQGERYMSGEQTDLELIAIARRAAEMEFEALRLIEVGHAK